MKESLVALAALAAMCAVMPVAQATENGGSTYPAAENFMMGAAPPPGFHMLGYATTYTATKNSDGNANANAGTPNFKLNVNVAAARFVWPTDKQLMGGSMLFHAIVPVVDLTLGFGGTSQHKTGLGDITLGAGVAYHHSQNLHSVMAIDVVAPTGDYKSTDFANIGRNYWSVQPTYLRSYINPNGFNGDFKLTYNYNTKNTATQYQSGDELFVDYALGYGLGNGWTVGAAGYWTKQATDDSGTGAIFGSNHKNGYAIGPAIKYQSPSHWFITARLIQETMRNAAEGTALSIKAILPL